MARVDLAPLFVGKLPVDIVVAIVLEPEYTNRVPQRHQGLVKGVLGVVGMREMGFSPALY